MQTASDNRAGDPQHNHAEILRRPRRKALIDETLCLLIILIAYCDQNSFQEQNEAKHDGIVDFGGRGIALFEQHINLSIFSFKKEIRSLEAGVPGDAQPVVHLVGDSFRLFPIGDRVG